jgi:hypothetical protein
MPPTGPKTARGKAKVSRNAVKHGIFDTAPVVEPIEDRGDWDRHLAGYRDSLEPVGYVEVDLVDRLAWLSWRLRRLQRYETDMIRVRFNMIADDLATAARYAKGALGVPLEQTLTEEAVEDQVTRRTLPDAAQLNNIVRYEAHIHRQFLQTLHELEAMQARRRGQSTPLARLDITGAPAG